MIWLSWRQLRTQATAVYAVVAALLVLAVITGMQLFDVYHEREATFLTRIQFDRFKQTLFQAGVVVMYVAPPVIGAFWGAPMVARELEAGTHRLVWNQSISRTRWLAVKVAITGAAAAAALGLLSLAVTWWSSPIDREVANGHAAGPFFLARMEPVLFGARGIVPVGYVLFSLALGIAVGLVLRRSVPAIAVTLAAVVIVQIVMPLVVRAHLVPPETKTVVIEQENIRGLMIQSRDVDADDDELIPMTIEIEGPSPGAWTLSGTTVDADGKAVSVLPAYMRSCVGPPPPPGEAVQERQESRDDCFQRLADDGYRQLVTYQPASRFWTLQWLETGLLVALAGLLTGFCFWRIRRDLS